MKHLNSKVQKGLDHLLIIEGPQNQHSEENKFGPIVRILRAQSQ